MSEIMDIRLQHHLAQEFYRQQMLQRIPDPYSSIFPTRQQLPPIPPRFTLPGAEVKLLNADLWSDFHKIGTEMIITKSGRRMFPSIRASLSGLENDQNYCVLLEMVPIADCRFKFSGSQWVPAGGAEPQSLQNIYIHPDSPALGSHWQAQPINFNKTKLTNNTLDSSGHIVLTSMHKYQPRIHIVRTSDPSQIPWSPQKSFAFAETEFVAVTAYQNDRITKLKIDNNPFAKGFRETGQSRCKRKIVPSSSNSSSSSSSNNLNMKSRSDEFSSPNSLESDQKRIRILPPSAFSPGSSMKDESGMMIYETSSSGTNSPAFDDRLMPQRLPYLQHHHYPMALQHYHQMINSQFMNLMLPHMNSHHSNMQRRLMEPQNLSPVDERQIDILTDDTSSNASDDNSGNSEKKSNFSISAILGLEKTTVCH